MKPAHEEHAQGQAMGEEHQGSVVSEAAGINVPYHVVLKDSHAVIHICPAAENTANSTKSDIVPEARRNATSTDIGRCTSCTASIDVLTHAVLKDGHGVIDASPAAKGLQSNSSSRGVAPCAASINVIFMWSSKIVVMLYTSALQQKALHLQLTEVLS